MLQEFHHLVGMTLGISWYCQSFYFAFGVNTLLESNKDYYVYGFPPDLSFIMIVFFMC